MTAPSLFDAFDEPPAPAGGFVACPDCGEQVIQERNATGWLDAYGNDHNHPDPDEPGIPESFRLDRRNLAERMAKRAAMPNHAGQPDRVELPEPVAKTTTKRPITCGHCPAGRHDRCRLDACACAAADHYPADDLAAQMDHYLNPQRPGDAARWRRLNARTLTALED